jgi:hypothetical protein
MALSQRLIYSYSSGFCYTLASVRDCTYSRRRFKFTVFCKATVPQTDKHSRTKLLPQVYTLQQGVNIFLHSLCMYTTTYFTSSWVFGIFLWSRHCHPPTCWHSRCSFRGSSSINCGRALKSPKAASVFHSYAVSHQFARSITSIRTHITACMADTAHAFITWKMATGCSGSCGVMLSGSGTLATTVTLTISIQ